MAKKKGICCYCGKPAESDDHIPPKSMVHEEDRNGVKFILVPACNACNRKYSFDDEYLMVLSFGSFDEDGTVKVQEKVLKWFNIDERGENKNRSKARRIMKGLQPIKIIKNGEVFDTFVYQIEKERIFRLSNRFVVGIYFDMFKKRLPENVKISSYIYRDHKDNPQIVKLRSHLDECPAQVVLQNRFSYRFKFFNSPPSNSIWQFDLFNVLRVYALTSSDFKTKPWHQFAMKRAARREANKKKKTRAK
jgi:hypothetical protein